MSLAPGKQQRRIAARFVFCIYLAILHVTLDRSSGQQGSTTPPASHSLTPEKLFSVASPAVVKLVVMDEDDREIGQGSGFILDRNMQAVKSILERLVPAPDGNVTINELVLATEKKRRPGESLYLSMIVTNYHVIRPAVSVNVLFHNGKHGWVSKVVAEDEAADLAVLIAHSQIEPTRTLKLHQGPIPPVGAKVYVVGSPFGLGNTLSEGLVSGYRERGERAPWIQITAPISPGSSGGPVLSTDGTVLAVTTASIKEGQSLNFAIPARDVQQLLDSPKNARWVWEGASIMTNEYANWGPSLSLMNRWHR